MADRARSRDDNTPVLSSGGNDSHGHHTNQHCRDWANDLPLVHSGSSLTLLLTDGDHSLALELPRPFAATWRTGVALVPVWCWSGGGLTWVAQMPDIMALAGLALCFLATLSALCLDGDWTAQPRRMPGEYLTWLAQIIGIERLAGLARAAGEAHIAFPAVRRFTIWFAGFACGPGRIQCWYPGSLLLARTVARSDQLLLPGGHREP